MPTKMATLAQALIVTAGLALAPAAFAQTPTFAATPKAAEVKPAAKAPVQTADAACAIYRKDSKELRDCTEKTKLGATKTAPAPAAAAPAAPAKEAVKKTN